METINIDALELEELRTQLRGAVYVPGDEGYDGARAAWNLNAHQYPALVVEAEGATDVLAAVRLAREQGLGVGVMATVINRTRSSSNETQPLRGAGALTLTYKDTTGCA